MPQVLRHKLLPCDGFFRRLVGCVTVIFLAVQILLPGVGKAQTAETWIEICSEFGAIEIKITEDVNSDSASSDQSENCPDCDICLMCTAQNDQARLTSFSASRLVLPKTLAGQMRPIQVGSNPAQFWHDGRGPPRLNIDKMARACGASMATTQFREEAPWT
ncbi:hypothetical protein PH5382_02704 [Phaeobacter sp. CECT 5382]|nr:hypothetical protein PH5382_02704 [Phaeobacter sp. CECT 5382]